MKAVQSRVAVATNTRTDRSGRFVVDVPDRVGGLTENHRLDTKAVDHRNTRGSAC